MKNIDTIDTTANDLTTSDRQIKLHHTVASFTTTFGQKYPKTLPLPIFGSLD